MFLTHFVISLMVSSFTIAVIMLIKKVFQKQLSAKWQYNLWFLLMIALTLPYIPNQFINFGNHFISLNVNQSNGISPSTIHSGDDVVSNENWMHDFTVSVNRPNLEFLNIIFTGIWIAGMLVLAVMTVHAWLKVTSIKSTTTELKIKTFSSYLISVSSN